MIPNPDEWTSDRNAELITLWYQEPRLSCKEIGARLGVSKSAVTGKVHRLNLKKRCSPVLNRVNLITMEERQRIRAAKFERERGKASKLKYEDKLEQLRQLMWNHDDVQRQRKINEQLVASRKEKKMAAWERASKSLNWIREEIEDEDAPQFSSAAHLTPNRTPVYL